MSFTTIKWVVLEHIHNTLNTAHQIKTCTLSSFLHFLYYQFYFRIWHFNIQSVFIYNESIKKITLNITYDYCKKSIIVSYTTNN